MNKTAGLGSKKPINLYKCMFWLVSAWLLIAALLGAFASSITAKVTRFNQWSADAAGASLSFIRPADGANDLEQQSYEKNAQLELEKFGLKRAPAGQVGRIQGNMVTGNGTRNRMYQEPIYRDNLVYHPPSATQLAMSSSAFGHLTYGARSMWANAPLYARCK